MNVAASHLTPTEIYRRLWRYAAPHRPMYLLGVLGMVMYAASQFYTVTIVRYVGAGLSGSNYQVLLWLPLLAVGIFVLRGAGD